MFQSLSSQKIIAVLCCCAVLTLSSCSVFKRDKCGTCPKFSMVAPVEIQDDCAQEG